jgi:hypothetical protein
VRTARAPDPAKAAPPPPGDPAEPPAPRRVKAALVMTGVNSFHIRLSPADEPEKRLTLILRRHGLFDWKVTDVELPS